MAHQLLEERARMPLPARPRRRTGQRGHGRLLAFLALAAFFISLIVLIATGLSSESRTAEPLAPPAHRTAPKPAATAKPARQRERSTPRKQTRPAPAVPIRLAGVAAYDPDGDGEENDSLAPLATDGDVTTSWHTEHYRTWYKPGVGLLLDAGRPVAPKTVTLQTDTPGFSAEIQTGASPQGPFTTISRSATTSETTVFQLRPPQPDRYLLVWITRIDSGAADVNEVRAR